MENNPVKKKRNFRWAITIGILIGTACVTAFAFMYKLPTVYKYEADSLNVETEQPNYAFLSVATLSKEAGAPYLKTGIDDVFYTFDSENTVTFYRYTDERFVKLKTSDTLDVTLTHGDTKAKISIAVFEKDGIAEGYGVYTDTSSVTFPYAFVKLINNNISNDEYDYLLYVDYSIGDFYKNDKSYSMLYAANKKGDNIKPIFSNKGVPTGPDGLIDDSFILIPGDFTGLTTDGFYFLTDRNYEPGTAFDLYKKTDIKGTETLICENIAAPHLFLLDKSVCFFMNGDNEDESEFKLCKMKDDKPVTIRTYSGTPDQYIVRGNYIFNAAAKTLYNVATGSEDGIRTSISINAVQDFAVSADGSKFALTGNFAGNSEKLLFYGLRNDRMNIIDGSDLFVSGHSNLAFLDDSVYFVMPGTTTDKISNFVISWDAIFSLN